MVAAADVGDAVVPALLQSFAKRATSVEATLGISTTDEMRALLSEHLADVAIGQPLAGPAAPGVVSEPLLRYRLLFVAGGRAPPAQRPRGDAAPAARRGVARRPDGDRPGVRCSASSSPGSACPEHRVRVFPTQSAAWAAAAAGDGVAPAIEQLWVRDPHPEVAPLEVAGTPIERLWHVSMLQGDRRPPVAARLHRFLATPDATQAMFRADGGVPASRFRPPVYITLWS